MNKELIRQNCSTILNNSFENGKDHEPSMQIRRSVLAILVEIDKDKVTE